MKGGVNGTVGQSSVLRVHGEREGAWGLSLRGGRSRARFSAFNRAPNLIFSRFDTKGPVKTKFLGWFSGSLKPFSMDIRVLNETMASKLPILDLAFSASIGAYLAWVQCGGCSTTSGNLHK